MEEEIAVQNHAETGNVVLKLIENEMKKSYLDYAMSVIVSRALPDVRDGLKPVHRRVLFAMNEMGMFHNKPYKKSARIVGECLGKYHPHGDSAVYDTMVRMAQPWSLRYILIDGQGNFGSVDGDNAAAMRYTEARLKSIAEQLLSDIKKETVDFQPNFDGSLKEPTVLPSRVPNLLVNGTSGIAVGMATNMPPHNIVEVIDGIIHYIENPEASVYDIMHYIKGPDFPTGGTILGNAGIKQAYLTGRGKLIIRAKAEEEEKKSRKNIIITELPYQVNKSALIEQIADLIRDKHVQGIADLKDESDREGMRIVITLKKDANSEIVLNQLYKHSRLQVTFGVNSLALVDQQPKTLNLIQIINHFINHRIEVVTRRTQYDLIKSEEKSHILEGLVIALENIDSVITLIKAAKSAIEAKIDLTEKYNLTEKQSQAILDMRLQRLTNLEQDKIRYEHKETMLLISELKSILDSKIKLMDIIKFELKEIKEKFKDERRTKINEGGDLEIDNEDLIEEEKDVVTITHKGYIKRQSMDSYKTQNRGGKGIIGTSTTEEDFVENLFVASTHSHMLLFTDKGQLHWLKVYMIPDGSRTSKGKALINLIRLDADERITAMIPVKEFNRDSYLVMITKDGTIKRCLLNLFNRPRNGGIRAISLDANNQLVNVLMTSGNNEVMIATKNGMAVKFNENDARSIGRNARGVKGITLKKNDQVIDAIICENNETILTVTEKGYGKRTPVSDYRIVRRGGIGVINIKCTEKNGKVVATKCVKDKDEIMMISQSGIMIRINAKHVPNIGRNTQGVRLMRLNQGDAVRAIAKIIPEDNPESEIIQNKDPIQSSNMPPTNEDIMPIKESEFKKEAVPEQMPAEPKNNSEMPNYNPKPNPENVPTLEELKKRQMMKARY